MEEASWKIVRKDWESDFFKKEIFNLNCKPSDFTDAELKNEIKSIPFDILEYNLETSKIDYSSILGQMGFLLVDSRISFITQIKQSDKGLYNKPDDVIIRLFNSKDKESILKLTNEFLENSKTFKSRYTNRYFFEKAVAQKYFLKWIFNSIGDKNSIIAVAEHNQNVIGYFIYQHRGQHLGLSLYKGILCSITKNFQGKKLHLILQNFLFQNFKEDTFYIDNTTQLSNIPILKNHIRSKRNLHSSFLTFMLKKEDFKI
ncbi:MAG: hypothetical protein V3V14_07765 [Saprospiraceae bacterium]